MRPPQDLAQTSVVGGLGCRWHQMQSKHSAQGGKGLDQLHYTRWVSRLTRPGRHHTLSTQPPSSKTGWQAALQTPPGMSADPRRLWRQSPSAGDACVTVLMVPQPPCASLKACTPIEEATRLRLPNTRVSPVGVDQPVGDPRTSGYITNYSRPHPQHRLPLDPMGLTVPASPVIQPPSPIAPLTLSICILFFIPLLTSLVACTAHSTPALIVLRLVPLAFSRYICIRFPVHSDSFPIWTRSNIDRTKLYLTSLEEL
jgi:hypothetical protein